MCGLGWNVLLRWGAVCVFVCLRGMVRVGGWKRRRLKREARRKGRWLERWEWGWSSERGQGSPPASTVNLMSFPAPDLRGRRRNRPFPSVCLCIPARTWTAEAAGAGVLPVTRLRRHGRTVALQPTRAGTWRSPPLGNNLAGLIQANGIGEALGWLYTWVMLNFISTRLLSPPLLGELNMFLPRNMTD